MPTAASVCAPHLQTCTNTPAPQPGQLQLTERYPVPAGDSPAALSSITAGAAVSPRAAIIRTDSIALESQPSVATTAVSQLSAGEATGAAAGGATATLAQLLSRCTENDETRELVYRAVQVAHAEHALVLRLGEIHERLSVAELQFAPQRFAGAFVIVNSCEVRSRCTRAHGPRRVRAARVCRFVNSRVRVCARR